MRTVLSAAVQEALAEGLQHPGGGEVVVRAPGGGGGKIYLFDRAVAWVKSAARHDRLSDVLLSRGAVPRDALVGVLEECQRTGANFAETLLRWGLLDKELLRECLRIHNASQLRGFADLETPIQAMFFPQARKYTRDFLFTLDELLEVPDGPAVTSAPASALHAPIPATPHPPTLALGQSPIVTPPMFPAVQLPRLHAPLADSLLAVPEAHAGAVWDFSSAQVLAAWSRDADGELGVHQAMVDLVSGGVRFAMQRLASADGGAHPQETVMSGGPHTLVMVPVPGRQGMQMVVAFVAVANLGMALAQARAAARQLAATWPPPATGDAP